MKFLGVVYQVATIKSAGILCGSASFLLMVL